MPNNTSNFRVTIISFNKRGLYGINQLNLESHKRFNVYADIPLSLYQGETVEINLNLQNNYDTKMQASILGDQLKKVDLEPRSKKLEVYPVTYNKLPFTLETFMTNKDSEKIRMNPLKLGYIVIERVAGLKFKEKTSNLDHDIVIPNSYVPNSLKLTIDKIDIKPDLILKGMDRLVREPYGCFEQTSCTTFPMVMLMQYLNKQEDTDKSIELKLSIMEKMKRGIKRLLGYECNSGGFDWFGSDPGHVTLTAYGIWQFTEMRKLDESLIDIKVIERSLAWLKSKCNQGQFTLRNGWDDFGKPPQLLSDAYILFVLSDLIEHQIDLKHIVVSKLEEYEKDKESFNDTYYLAFIGLIYHRMGEKQKAIEVMKKIQTAQEDEGAVKRCKTTITRSSGKSLHVETTSLAIILALNIEDSQFSEFVKSGIEYLISNMDKGYFCSTQGTILALKAIITYLESFSSESEETSFSLVVDDKKIRELTFPGSSKDQEAKETEIDLSVELNNSIKQEPSTVNINFGRLGEITDKTKKCILSLTYSYELTRPTGIPDSQLKLTANQLDLGNTLLSKFALTNSSEEEAGMVVLIMQKDSDCLINLNDLENLRLKGTVDFYEMRHNNSQIIFYWRGMGPKETKNVEISLLKKFKVHNKMQLYHRAYLYYGKEESEVYATYA